MKETITFRRIWVLAYPIILGSIAQNLINVVDTAFLGRLGAVPLGAAALGGLFYYIITMLGFGFGTGLQIIIARRVGQGRTNRVGEVWLHAFLFLVPFSILMFFFIRYFSSWVLYPLIESHEIFEGTKEFLSYRSYGIFFAYLNVLFRSFFIGIEKTRIISYSTFFMAMINIVLDYAFIFGNLGAPELGLKGAAIASSISEFSATIFLLAYSLNKVSFVKYGFNRFKKFKVLRLIKILKIAGPVMIQSFISISCWFTFFLLVEKIGEDALAVSNIIRSIYIIFFIPVQGFSSATNVLVSNFIGKGAYKEVLRIIFRVIKLCLIGVGVIVAICWIAPKLLISIYTDDPNLISMSLAPLKVISITAFTLTSGFIFYYGVMGTGKTMVAFYIELLALVVYVSFAYTIIHFFHANVAHAWTVEGVYGLMMTLLSFLYIKYGKWKHAKI
ncbi:MAG: MATE family efflux transporter [Hyphomicrobiales bacterium]